MLNQNSVRYVIFTRLFSLHKEYNSQGQQILDVPMNNGVAEGDGWKLDETGRKQPVVFKKGRQIQKHPRATTERE